MVGISLLSFFALPRGAAGQPPCVPCSGPSNCSNPANFSFCVSGCTVDFVPCNTSGYQFWDFGQPSQPNNQTSNEGLYGVNIFGCTPAGSPGPCANVWAYTPQHTYTIPQGQTTATFTVTHRFTTLANPAPSDIQTQTLSVTVTTNQVPPLNAGFTVTEIAKTCNSYCVRVTGSANQACFLTQTWNFGDGSSTIVGLGTEVASIEHCYTTAGNFTISHSIQSCTTATSSLPVNAVFDPLSTQGIFNLTVSKATSTPTVAPNGTAQFSIALSNPGSMPAFNVEVKDKFPSGLIPVLPLPAGATLDGGTITIPVATLAAGASQTFNLSFKASTICAGSLVNEAWVRYPACNHDSPKVTASVTVNTSGASIVNFAGGSVTAVPGYPFSNPILLKVNGNLTIDDPNNLGVSLFPAGSIVQMGNGLNITVQPNKTLWLDNTYLHSCDKLWEGIIMTQNASLITEEQSIIEDAKHAIRVVNDATLNIQQTTFNKNYIGISATETLATGDTRNTATWMLHNNTFQCTEQLRPKYDNAGIPAGAYSFAGMNVSRLSQLSIVESGTNVTIFRDMKYGIKSSLSPVIVEKVRFVNIQPGLYPGTEAFGIYATGSASGSFLLRQRGWGMGNSHSFEDCHTGIFASQMNIDIMSNRMKGMGRGIMMASESNKGVSVLNNSILCGKRGIRLALSTNPTSIVIAGNSINLTPTGTGEALGISLDAVSENLQLEGHVRNNSVVHKGHSTGIDLRNSSNINVFTNLVNLGQAAVETNGIRSKGGGINTISFNQVWGDGVLNNSVASGINVFNSHVCMVCDSTRLTFSGVRITGMSTSPERFLGNKFNTHTFGLHFTGTGVLDEQIRNGNKWWGTYSGGMMAKHDGGLLMAGESPFITHLVTLPYLPPANLRDPNDPTWFDDISGSFYTCSPSIPFCETIAHKTGFDYGVAEGVFLPPIHAEGMKWMGRRGLFDKLQKSPSLLSGDATMSGFYQANQSTAISGLIEAEKAIGEAYVMSASDASALQAIETNISAHVQNLAAIDSAMFYASGAGLASLQSQKNSEMASLQSKMNLASQVLTPFEAGRLAGISQAYSQNAEIIPTSIQEENEKTVNEVFLESFALNITELSSSQVALLEPIAAQCPLDGGNAVIAARVMLEQDNGRSYVDEDICLRSTERSSGRQPKGLTPSERLRVYPNPASAYLLVEWPGVERETSVQVSNSFGEIVHEVVIPTKGQFQTIDISHLPNGLYYLRVIQDGGVPVSEKFTIQR